MKVTRIRIYNIRNTGIGGATTMGGKLYATDAPGLGAPDFESLGPPVANYEAF